MRLAGKDFPAKSSLKFKPRGEKAFEFGSGFDGLIMESNQTKHGNNSFRFIFPFQPALLRSTRRTWLLEPDLHLKNLKHTESVRVLVEGFRSRVGHGRRRARDRGPTLSFTSCRSFRSPTELVPWHKREKQEVSAVSCRMNESSYFFFVVCVFTW